MTELPPLPIILPFLQNSENHGTISPQDALIVGGLTLATLGWITFSQIRFGRELRRAQKGKFPHWFIK